MATTGTKLSQQPRPQGQTGTKLSGQSPPQGQPVQNSPSTGKTAHFSPSSASREKNIPVQTQTTRAGRIFSRRPPLTSHAAHTPRYKTLPAQEKPPISAHLARAGRKISRSRRKQPEQGESFPADHHPPPTQRTLPGTKLSQHPPPQGQTGTKLSPHSKKHLFQPIRGEQGEKYPGPDANNPSRENLFPQTTTHHPRSAHSPVQNSPSIPHLKAKPVQNSPHTPRRGHARSKSHAIP